MRKWRPRPNGSHTTEVHVLQGERPMAKDNRTLGRLHLAGLPPSPRGVPQIEVSFDIDANGIVHVAAKDLATGAEQKITITSSSGLAKDEADQMVRTAEAHAAEDKAKCELVDARNEAGTLAYSVEKTVNEQRDNLAADDVQAAESAVTAVRNSVTGDDTKRTREATERLYSHQAQSGPADAGETASDADTTEVVDAEFAEVQD